MRFKRILPVIVVLAALVLCSVSVSAADVVAEGTCGANGDNLTWVLDSDGVLTISGSGEMENYNDKSWGLYAEEIKEVIISEGVTSVGDYAFAWCSSLTSVNIPDSVTNMGESVVEGTAYYNDEANWEDGVLYIANYLIAADNSVISGEYTIKPGTKTIADSAFNDCSSLTSVSIPEGVMRIGDEAFLWCRGLTSVNIGNGVTSIDSRAFYGCSSLTSISIPDSVMRIGDEAFSGTAYYNDKANWEDGALYIDNHLIAADNSVISGEYTIKPGTKTIADSAFVGCRSLTSVNIPDSVTSIGESAFSICSSLADVYYNGLESNWEEIEIGSDNDELLNANIIFGVKDDIELVSVTTGADRCSFMFKVAEDKVSKGKLFAAVYDAEGALIGAGLVEANAKNLPMDVKVTGVPANCKAFLWDGMKPLAVSGKWMFEN